MPAGDWKLIVTDVSGNELGELIGAMGVKLSYGRNRPTTLTFTLRQDDPLTRYIIEGKSRIKAYRNGVLRAYNVVWDCQDEFSVDGSVVQVATASPMYLLGRRFILADKVYSNVTPGSVLLDQLTLQNASYFTGINVGTAAAFGATSVTFTKYANVLDSFNDLVSGWDWLDWEVLPADLTAVGGVYPMGTLYAYNTQGIDNLGVFFEFGVGKDNLVNVNITNNMDKISTDVTVVGKTDGDVQYASVSPSSEYTTTRAAYKAKYETLETFTDISTQTFLDSLRVNYHDFRNSPRQTVSFTPSPEGGEYHPFDSYAIGDRVTFRLNEGRQSIDGSVRIEGFTIDLGVTGEERVSEIRTTVE